jgi:hypothetical protein
MSYRCGEQMKWKNIVAGGILGGILLLAIVFLSSIIAVRVAPFDYASLGGMRALNDPIMALYVAYPFLLAFATSVAFDLVRDSLKGTVAMRGMLFGVLLLIVNTIPTLFVIYTSMSYPAGFYLANIIAGGVGYPLLGILYAYIWDRVG